MQYEEKQGQGALFLKPEQEVVAKGKFLVDGEHRYLSLVKSSDRNGNVIYELSESIGRVFFNPADQKKNEKSPDFGGKVKMNGQDKKFAGWLSTSQKGDKYISAKIEADQNQRPPQPTAPQAVPDFDDLDDTIPF